MSTTNYVGDDGVKSWEMMVCFVTMKRHSKPWLNLETQSIIEWAIMEVGIDNMSTRDALHIILRGPQTSILSLDLVLNLGLMRRAMTRRH